MSGPSFTGSIAVPFLPSAPMLHGGRELPGLSFEKCSKNTTARSRRLGLRRVRVVLDPLRDHVRMRLRPRVDVGAVRRVALTHACASALCASAHCATICGLPSKLILLEPRLDIRRDQLACLRAARCTSRSGRACARRGRAARSSTPPGPTRPRRRRHTTPPRAAAGSTRPW